MLFCRGNHAWILRDCVVPDRYETDNDWNTVRKVVKLFHIVTSLANQMVDFYKRHLQN